MYLPTPLAFVSGLPRPLFLLLSPFKVLAGSLALLWTLLFRLEHAPAFMFVQVSPNFTVGEMEIDGERVEPTCDSNIADSQGRLAIEGQQSHHRLAQYGVLGPLAEVGVETSCGTNCEMVGLEFLDQLRTGTDVGGV